MDTAYQPIENYGIIGDLHTAALISINGSIDFMCFPDFDSPTIFGALLDKDKGGFFQISSCEDNVKNKQIYIPETNILITRFLHEDGIGEVTDFMPTSSFCNKNVLIRKVTSIKGKNTFQMRCCPRFNYGMKKHTAKLLNEKEILFSSKEEISLKLVSSVPIKIKQVDGYAKFSLKQGETAEFILHNPNDLIPFSQDFIESAFIHTLNYWKAWTSQSTYNGRWREFVMRSALSLKLLISEKHGAIIAAPTFGLPEKIGGNKNWDYRFVWIRDGAFALYALLSIGYKHEAESFMKWVQNLFHQFHGEKELQPLYKLDGSDAFKTQLIPHFEGYHKSYPVVIGNDALSQLQLDIYGEFIHAFYLCDKYVFPIAHETWLHISNHIQWLTHNWKRKDYSIWESQGKPQDFLYSRLMCWVAFDRAIKIADFRSFPYPETWIKIRNEIFQSIYKDFWNEKKGAFIQHKRGRNVDASCLLMPIMKFISPKDPQWLSTMKCIEENLVTDCLVYRYKPSQGTLFGLEKGEGTFSACSFWFIECLSQSGQLQKAQLYFDKMLSYANHLGLYSEQLGFRGDQLGNFPQAFTHLALISAAYDLNNRLNENF